MKDYFLKDFGEPFALIRQSSTECREYRKTQRDLQKDRSGCGQNTKIVLAIIADNTHLLSFSGAMELAG